MANFIPVLSTITGAIKSSYQSVVNVALLIVLFFAYYAIAGVLLFKNANPWYFADVPRTFRTLFQIMTMDSWSSIMRMCIYGCYYMYGTGYEDFDNTCDSKEPGLGWWAPLFFVSFIILSAMVLVSLLIGVIITSMELLKQSINDENDMWKKVRSIQHRYKFSNVTLSLLLELFEKLDHNKNSTLSFDELKPIMDVVNMPSSDQFAFYVLVDTDHSGQIDFGEFCEMIMLIAASKDKDKPNKPMSPVAGIIEMFSPKKGTKFKESSSPMNFSLTSFKNTFDQTLSNYMPARQTPKSGRVGMKSIYSKHRKIEPIEPEDDVENQLVSQGIDLSPAPLSKKQVNEAPQSLPVSSRIEAATGRRLFSPTTASPSEKISDLTSEEMKLATKFPGQISDTAAGTTSKSEQTDFKWYVDAFSDKTTHK